MSVSETQPALRRADRGFLNPSYPQGVWAGAATLTGDGSGGSRTVTFNLQDASEAFSALAFSVERVSLNDTDDNSKQCGITTGGFLLLHRQNVGLSAGGLGAARIQGNDMPVRMFLGRTIAGVSTLMFEVANANGGVFNVRVEGYWWSVRSINAEGGYRLPADSPWRA